MRVQNYGNWKGDRKGGHHPPACTCYRCNEQRREEEAAQEETRRAAEYDRRVVENRERARTEAEREKPKPQPAPRRPPGTARNPQRAGRANVPKPASPRRAQETRAFRVSRAVTASALRYALALHAAAAVGLVVYALVQGGASSVLPTLGGAGEAYVQAWRTMGAMAGLG